MDKNVEKEEKLERRDRLNIGRGIVGRERHRKKRRDRKKRTRRDER